MVKGDEKYLSDFLEERLDKIKLEIEQIPEHIILQNKSSNSRSLEETLSDIVKKYGIAVMDIDHSGPLLSKAYNQNKLSVKLKISVSNYNEVFADWTNILQLRASKCSAAPIKLELESFYNSGYIATIVPTDEAIIDQTLKQIYNEIEWRNFDVRSFNDNIVLLIQRLAKERKKKLENENDIIQKLSDKYEPKHQPAGLHLKGESIEEAKAKIKK